MNLLHFIEQDKQENLYPGGLGKSFLFYGNLIIFWICGNKSGENFAKQNFFPSKNNF